MTTFAVDTDCMIAVVAVWDNRHAEASAEIEVRLARGEHMAISLHALTETYSVLTRLPLQFRLSTTQAWELLEAMFLSQCSLNSLDTVSHLTQLRKSAEAGISGGRIYDAIIGECARQAGASVLLTFHRRHFEPAPEGVTIVEPSV
jgi:predicted nucleic acid-binding protein